MANIAKYDFVAEFPAQPIDDPTGIAARISAPVAY
jgi:hypothetical protein